MSLYYNGMYLGKIEPNEYTVKELQAAGFTVIVEQESGLDLAVTQLTEPYGSVFMFVWRRGGACLTRTAPPIITHLSCDCQ